MPAVTSFPLLQRPFIERQSLAVVESFPDKLGKRADRLQENIAEVFAEYALSKSSPSLLMSVENGKNGFTHAIKARGAIFIVDEHWEGGKQCLKLFPPMKPADFKPKKLESDGVAGVYGEKTWQDVDRIVLDLFPSRGIDVFLNGDRYKDLEGTWAKAVAESALTVLNRAKNNASRSADALDDDDAGTGAGAGAGTAKIVGGAAQLVDTLVGAKPKVAAGPTLGTDLEAAVSWRGMPVVVTSDRSGDESVHVMIERRGADGTGTWWPIAVPDHPGFPKRGCNVLLEGDQLVVSGGFDADGKISSTRFAVDLAQVLKPGFSAAAWKERPPLRDATAWAAAALSERENVVVGGVAGFYVGKNKAGADVKIPRMLANTQLGGAPQWRDRSAPPQVTAGSSTVVDQGCVFVGPSAACDGKACVFDQREGMWFSLPDLPLQVGLGQLAKRGDDLVYAGGFDADGKASKKIFTIDLKDPMATWVERGDSEAVAGKARLVQRDGKLVSLLVAPKGALMVHLE